MLTRLPGNQFVLDRLDLRRQYCAIGRATILIQKHGDIWQPAGCREVSSSELPNNGVQVLQHGRDCRNFPTSPNRWLRLEPVVFAAGPGEGNSKGSLGQ